MRNDFFEDIARKMGGHQWRLSDENTKNAGWGMCIIKAILDGVPIELNKLSSYLCVDRDTIFPAFKHLSLNGMFIRDKIWSDANLLRNGDDLTWGYYGGYACGATGPWTPNRC